MTITVITDISFDPKRDANELSQFLKKKGSGWTKLNTVSSVVIYRKYEHIMRRNNNDKI